MSQNQYDVAVRVKGNVSPQDSEKFTKAVAELAKSLGLEAGFEIEPINDDSERSYSKIVVNTWRAGVPGSKIITFHHVTQFKQVGSKIEFYYLRKRSNSDLVSTRVVCFGECLMKTVDVLTLVSGKRSEGMSAKSLGV